MKENIIKNKNYNQVCVWPGTIVGKDRINDFINFMEKTFEVRIQYLEEIKTFPDRGNPETGGRNDLFFAIHDDDIMKL